MTLSSLVFVGLLVVGLAFPAYATAPKRVALIFDDGPTTESTQRLLDVLAKEQVHITFGTVARNAEAHPELSKAAVKAGHEIANHSYAHEHPKELSDAQLDKEVLGAQAIFEKQVGVKPRWYWPPFIEIDPRLEALVTRAGMRIYPFRKIVASMDFVSTVSAAELVKNATTGVEDGTVVLCHEWRADSIDQLPAILAELRRQGCVFLTFSELEVSLEPQSTNKR